jgi:hypothetical protein
MQDIAIACGTCEKDQPARPLALRIAKWLQVAKNASVSHRLPNLCGSFVAVIKVSMPLNLTPDR